MTDTPELSWAQLDNLTSEVRGDHGPGTGNWESQGSHTQAFNRASSTSSAALAARSRVSSGRSTSC
jgi:hypothetical protein